MSDSTSSGLQGNGGSAGNGGFSELIRHAVQFGSELIAVRF